MLVQAQKSLEDHFSRLASERLALGYPVYAFEHGFDEDQIQVVRTELFRELKRTRQLDKSYWLLWTALSAEVGYSYDGDEYWHSFQHGNSTRITVTDRETIRGWFRHFSRSFSGFKPTGRWANHFSIIAWPITHSILPRYLQSQFARHLYDLRHELAANGNEGLEQMGQLLGERYHGGSSRFEHFLQQTALTALLVVALRDGDTQDVVTPIFKPTLARIVQDLEKKGASRSYLRDARHVLQDTRWRVRSGLAPTAQPSPRPENHTRPLPGPPPGIKLVARRKRDDIWTLGVALPDFPALIAHANADVSVLNNSRAQFVDRPNEWMPGRALLSYSNSSHALASLPDPSEPIICFRETDTLARSMTANLKIIGQAPWLLRIHDDGVARQVLGNHVRSAAEYLVVTTQPVEGDLLSMLAMRQAASQTSGALFYHMVAPRTVAPSFVEALRKLSFGYSLKADVKAFGLSPRWDDATGCSVWTTTEEIILQLSADFVVEEFSISIDEGPQSQLPVSDQKALLISLGQLAVGRHVVEVSAKPRSATGHVASMAPESIAIEVRAPAPWLRSSASRHGLRVIVEPQSASLDDLVEKRAELTVHGPAGRVASVEAHLHDFAGHISGKAELGRLSMPTSPGVIPRLIEKLAAGPLSERVQSAPRVALSFAVEELGVATISFPHAVAPLRWKLHRDSDVSIMRLVDEAGVGASVAVNRFNMVSPDLRLDTDLSRCLAGTEVEPPGTLYVARYDGGVCSAFASAPAQGRLTALSELGVPIVLSSPGTDARDIMRLLAILRQWRSACSFGPLAIVRKANVVAALEEQIARLACGANWVQRVAYSRRSNGRLEQLQRDVGGSPGFASRMRTTEWTWHSDSGGALREFARLAIMYNIAEDERLCDLAFRLAFDPAGIRLTNPAERERQFEALASMQVLARGAYFAKMAFDTRFQQADQQGGT